MSSKKLFAKVTLNLHENSQSCAMGCGLNLYCIWNYFPPRINYISRSLSRPQSLMVVWGLVSLSLFNTWLVSSREEKLFRLFYLNQRKVFRDAESAIATILSLKT